MKNILMIATGGTIASKEGDLGLTPAVTGEELAASVPGIKDICHLEVLQLMNIDSTNMRPRQWLMIRDAIMENYNNYDGFVVLHGTDTMAYTAAALSYLIQDSVKPIVLTGSQKPMANPYTDAKINLFQSILYAADDLSCNVCIVFNGKVVAGTRGRKQRTRSFDAFDSMALTPMVITARMVKKDHPDARICFIGPCAAKKLEANRKSVRSDVDYVLTFEELQGMFDAKNIDFTTLEADPEDGLNEGTSMGRGFAVGGGVAAAVVEAIKHIDPTREVQIEYGDGLRECKKMLMMAKAGKRNGYLLEGMGCPGGCVAGAGTITPVRESTLNVEKFKKEAAEVSSTASPYVDRLKDVEE